MKLPISFRSIRHLHLNDLTMVHGKRWSGVFVVNVQTNKRQNRKFIYERHIRFRQIDKYGNTFWHR